tara:strand:- start:174 stop:665 length:492 start_codon:yes stop_codon:yes gene_type:complete
VKPVRKKLNQIKLDSDQIKLINLFNSITRGIAKDVVIDKKFNRLIFVVNSGQMGLALGKEGIFIKKLYEKIKRPIELVEFADTPEQFLKNILASDLSSKEYTSEFVKELDDTLQVKVTVSPSKKGQLIGREGRHAERARLLMRKYYSIGKIKIDTPEESTLKW